MLVTFRLFQALFLTYNLTHPDAYWQATEVAYNMAYGGVELPWEWTSFYKLRNSIYPLYLYCYLGILKSIGLDYGFVVRMYPYIAEIILVIISDYYFWEVGKKTVSTRATRIAFIFYLTNRIYNEMIIRTFTNSLECIFQIIAFYYFLDVKDKFDKATAIMTGLLSLSFMIRSTSPIGWIPLLVMKIVYDKSLFAFLQAGVVVAIPILSFCVAMDSIYYGEFTFTAWNFLKVNLYEDLAKYFGTDPSYYYFFAFLPVWFTVAYPVVMFSMYVYLKDSLRKQENPYMLYLTLFYLFVFSLIAHKEMRFVTPLFPFMTLMLGYYLSTNLKNYSRLI